MGARFQGTLQFPAQMVNALEYAFGESGVDPVGFSAEFYSELIRLQRERDLQRLLAQYPAHGVEVDDAGILMTQDPHSSLAPLRTVLQGHAGLHAQH